MTVLNPQRDQERRFVRRGQSTQREKRVSGPGGASSPDISPGESGVGQGESSPVPLPGAPGGRSGLGGVLDRARSRTRQSPAGQHGGGGGAPQEANVTPRGPTGGGGGGAPAEIHATPRMPTGGASGLTKAPPEDFEGALPGPVTGPGRGRAGSGHGRVGGSIGRRRRPATPNGGRFVRITRDNTLQNQRIRLGDPNSGINRDMRSGVRQLLGSSPDRSDLVRRRFEGQQQRLEEEREGRMEDVRERTARMGRTGSGMVNEELAEVEQDVQEQENRLLGQLTADAAGREVRDRRRNLGTANRISGDLLGQEMKRGQFLRGERQFENRLARQAQQDEARRLRFLRRGFSSDPTGTMLASADVLNRGAGRFGGQAGRTNNQLSRTMALAQQRRGGGGGGGLGSLLGEGVGAIGDLLGIGGGGGVEDIPGAGAAGGLA